VLDRFFTFLRFTCRDDSGIFDHQNHRPLGGSRPMHHRPRHHKRLTGRQFYDTILKIDQQPPGNDIKELIILIMFVPMEFPFNDADRTTESFTLHKVWLSHLKSTVSTNLGISINSSGWYRIFSRVS
jgi:hypothetical protein